MKICFPLIAQTHQAFHALPLALELARHYPDVEVHVACTTPGNLAAVQALARAYDPQAQPVWKLLHLPDMLRGKAKGQPELLPPKSRTLLWNLPYFRGFDALVMPERTSLVLRRFLPRRTALIWTRHGAGDRAGGFTPDIAKLDFVLMAGPKLERRLLDKGLIRPGAYVTGVYTKFDLVRRLQRPPLFDNGRPTIVYNPHFLRYSSWPHWGMQLLERFAANDRYNLVFAPHIRLFYPVDDAALAPFARFRDLPHMRIDLGSDASADMTYTLGADIYIGDVSSQISEFVSRPRPAIFLNPLHIPWQGDADFRFWELGPVVDSLDGLDAALGAAGDPAYLARQAEYAAETFPPAGVDSAPLGAGAIYDFLKKRKMRGG